jgi:hypothetical protein
MFKKPLAAIRYAFQSLKIVFMQNAFANNYSSQEYPLKMMQHAALDIVASRAPFIYVDAHGTDDLSACLFHAAKSLGISDVVFKAKLKELWGTNTSIQLAFPPSASPGH